MPQFLANTTKITTDAMQQKKDLNLQGVTSKVSFSFIPGAFSVDAIPSRVYKELEET